MIRGLCPDFDQQAYLDGTLTPVYFGSALNNFGVRELLAGLGTFAPRRVNKKPKAARLSPMKAKSPPSF